MPPMDVASYQSKVQTKTTAVTCITHKFSYIINVTTGWHIIILFTHAAMYKNFSTYV